MKKNMKRRKSKNKNEDIKKRGKGKKRKEYNHLDINNWKKSCSDFMHSPPATDRKNMSLVLVVCMCHHLSTLSTTTVMIK